MIAIRIYKAYWESIATRILAALNYTITPLFVRTELELTKKIKEIADQDHIMVVVIPSSDTTSVNYDNIKEKETGIVYALKKTHRGNENDEDALTTMDETQQIITKIKELMLDDAQDCDAEYHQLMKDLDFNRMHTDPEYEFLGCDGYSVSFIIQTNGF